MASNKSLWRRLNFADDADMDEIAETIKSAGVEAIMTDATSSEDLLDTVDYGRIEVIDEDRDDSLVWRSDEVNKS